MDGKCKSSIYTDGATDTFSRYQFWSVAVALTGVCVRNGQAGEQVHLGRFPRQEVHGKTALTSDLIGFNNHLSMEVGPA